MPTDAASYGDHTPASSAGDQEPQSTGQKRQSKKAARMAFMQARTAQAEAHGNVTDAKAAGASKLIVNRAVKAEQTADSVAYERAMDYRAARTGKPRRP